MEIINFLQKTIDTLERSNIFVAARFLIGFYMLVIVAAMILIAYRLHTFGYFKEALVGVGRINIKAQRDKAQKKWAAILERLQGDNPDNHKAAVLQAANFFNEILAAVGYEGETLGEKFEKMEGNQFDNLADLKQANQLKNKIVQQEDFELDKETATEAVAAFEDALKNIEAIY